MGEKDGKRKARRRVSFNIPEKEIKEQTDTPAVTVSIREAEDFDDEFETADTPDGTEIGKVAENGTEESDSDDSDSEGSDSDNSDKATEVTSDAGAEERANVGLDSESGSSSEESDEKSDDAEEVSSDSDSSEDGESSGAESSDEETDGDSEVREKAPVPLSSFGEMSLDPRVERAIERIGWRKPTPVQSAVIPAALSGRDVLVSAPTGSGKTGAYVVPIVQHLCNAKRTESTLARAVVLVPTRELVHQVTSVIKLLCKYVAGVQVAAVSGPTKTGRKGSKRDNGKNGSAGSGRDKDGEGFAFTRSADIMVGTPASILKAAGSDENNTFSGVEFVVVDEADLVLSYGYENDARAALAKIPLSAQSMLLSATLESEGIDGFRKLVLRRPLTIKVTTDADLKDGDPTGASHYFARLKNPRDRYLVAYAMLRLNVICGKVLIFVNHVNSAFRLKLFLDQFKVKSAVLNSELPANSRMHCVDQFNAGIFDILIATDESKKDMEEKKKADKKGKKEEKKKKRKRVEKDEEFGLSRGVDFRNVAAVLNFDVPGSVISYTHRAGRTARAGRSGTVLTLVCADGEEERVRDLGRNVGVPIGPLSFRMDQIEAFRYRVEDCLRMVTDTAVNGARLADVHREIVNSEQLQEYFEDNPQDLDALQHNMSLAKNVPDHLGHIPTYLLPAGLRGAVGADGQGSKFRVKRRKRGGLRRKGGTDPLKSLSNKSVEGSSRQRFQERHGISKAKKGGGGMIRKRKRTFKMR